MHPCTHAPIHLDSQAGEEFREWREAGNELTFDNFREAQARWPHLYWSFASNTKVTCDEDTMSQVALRPLLQTRSRGRGTPRLILSNPHTSRRERTSPPITPPHTHIHIPTYTHTRAHHARAFHKDELDALDDQFDLPPFIPPERVSPGKPGWVYAGNPGSGVGWHIDTIGCVCSWAVLLHGRKRWYLRSPPGTPSEQIKEYKFVQEPGDMVRTRGGVVLFVRVGSIPARFG